MAARSQRLGQAPVEVAERLEAADARVLQAPLQAAPAAFLLLPVEQAGHPLGGGGFRPVRQQSMQMQRAGAGAQGGGIIHRPHP